MSASVTQLPSSCTRAAGVESGKAFCGRSFATRSVGRFLASGGLAGLAGVRRDDRLWAGLDMVTDILRHVPLAVHSA